MSLFRRIANLFSRPQLDREIDAELRSHIEMRIDDNVAAGMPAESARRNAMLRFGNRTVFKERTASADAALSLEAFLRDLRLAVRSCLRSPAFSFTAAITLALAIGANVLVFAIFDSLVLNPIRVPASDRIFSVVQQPHGYDTHSYPDYIDFRNRNRTFLTLAAYKLSDAAFNAGGLTTRAWFYEVSGNYFEMLDLHPQLGRLFTAQDEHGPDSAPYAVISDSFWRRRFNADPSVIGTTVRIDTHPFTILGVAPKGFHGTEVFLWSDFWVPIVNEEQLGDEYLSKRRNHGIRVMGRLLAGVTPQQAASDLNAIAVQLSKENPGADDGLGARLVAPGWFGDELGEPARGFMRGLLFMALLVLVAACTNVASIFAARISDRGREVALRLALGSTRWRVVRQVTMEAVVISLAGGVCGTLLALGLLSLISRWQPFPQFPAQVAIAPDWTVYGVALTLSLGSGMLPGLLPARQIQHASVMPAIKRNSSGTLLRRLTLRDLLLATQIAVCALLLTAALVSLRGMQRSLHASIGFQPRGVVIADTDLQMAGYREHAALEVVNRLLFKVGQAPGVTAVGAINETPLNTDGDSTPVYREGTTTFRQSDIVFSSMYYLISPGYLQASGTSLLRGRDFTWHDATNAPKVALINTTFAHRFFGDASPIGRRVLIGENSLAEIVGVVEQGKYISLTEDPKPAMFFPLAQSMGSDLSLVVRSALPASYTVRMLRGLLRTVDPNLAFTVSAWPDALNVVYFPAQVATASLGVMGLLAAILAITGVFGMAAYAVSTRWKELGIRVSLGAQRARLMRSALGRPLLILMAGGVAGLSGGVLASRLLAQIVYGATPRDPLVLSGVLLIMAFVGFIATWLPARRVLKVDPAQLLREE